LIRTLLFLVLILIFVGCAAYIGRGLFYAQSRSERVARRREQHQAEFEDRQSEYLAETERLTRERLERDMRRMYEDRDRGDGRGD